MKRITILGGYGAHNYGDDIMLYSLIKEMYSIDTAIEIDVFAVSKDVYLPEGVSVCIHVLKRGEKTNNIINFIKIIRRSKLLFMSGGTVFTDEDSVGAFEYFLLARIIGCPIAYVGVGIGNLRRMGRLIKTKLLVDLSEFVSVRDEYSYGFIKKISKNKDLYYTEDLAYLYYSDNLFKYLGVNKEKYLLVSWRDLTRYYGVDVCDMLLEKIKECVVYLIEKKYVERIVFMPLDDNVDADVNQKIYDSFLHLNYSNKLVFLNNLCTEKKTEYISKSSFFITSRLHGYFVAKMLGVRAIVFNYSDKVKYFCSSVCDDCFLSVDDFDIENNPFIDKIDLLRSNGVLAVDEDVLNDKVNLAYENIALIRDLVLRGPLKSP